ncbi:MAG: T9SS C-terminal target domain-containing protein [Balneolaceae bacterium]|nr:MAG: T9SS C-terminal target domain-containing protein [Balneolaceae bacterium]
MYIFKRYILAISILVLMLASTSVTAQTLQPPVFSHSAGTFTQPFDLEMEAEENTVIYFTTNGNLPGLSDQQYQTGQPVPVSGSVMIRARAFRDGFEPGPAVTKIYSQLHPNVADFDSNLPLVIVHQFDDVMERWGAYRSTVGFSVIDIGQDGRARLLSDKLHLQSLSESNYRGSSSLGFPKKQFGVRLIDDSGENRNESVLGMPSENNWIMSAPYDDKTLIRNAIAYDLGRDMGRYAPRLRFVELFLHDGNGPVTASHYHGVYMLVERVKWDNNRVNITKLTPEDNAEPEITGGYIINYDRDDHFRSSFFNTRFSLIRPSVEDITPQQRNWISGYTGGLEAALFGSNFRDPDAGYAAWLDTDSFVDYHLMIEALKEMDGFRLSTIMHKDRGGKMVMGPIWDYNLSTGNYKGPWSGAPTGWYHTHLNPTQYLNGWYTRLFQDEAFSRKYSDRWWQLRQGPYATEHIVNMIRGYAELLEEAQERNFIRWPILGEWVWEYSRDGYDTWEEEIEWLIDWVEKRMDWIDSQMPEPSEEPESRLRYFWFFGSDLINNTPLESVEATYSLVEQATIRFESALDGYPFTDTHPLWRKASMERRNRPTEINYHPEGNQGRPYDQNTMRALQVKQPFTGNGGENTLIFEMPTSGLEGVIFSFAAMDEGAATALLIDYSTETGGPVWTDDGLANDRYPLDTEFQRYSIDFSGIDDVMDNPDFRVRIRFDGDNMSADNGNRVTFNNISLEIVPDTTTKTDEEPRRPVTFRLDQNYPNPFNPGTIIPFEIPLAGNIKLEVYDMLGRKVATLVDDFRVSGRYEVPFDATGLASGVYIYRLITRDNVQSRKFTIIK